jgi:hypothetical protein
MSAEQLITHIIKEWAIIKQAPVAFILLVVFAFAFAGVVWVWMYSSTIETITQRMSAKDDLLAEYRERLHIAPPDHTKYSTLTNKELIPKVLAHAVALREFGEKLRRNSYSETDSYMSQVTRQMSEEEKAKVWDAHMRRQTQSTLESESEYKRRFHASNLIFRDELLSRLPPTARDRGEDHWYEYPNTWWSPEHVAKDLERLVKLLPGSPD